MLLPGMVRPVDDAAVIVEPDAVQDDEAAFVMGSPAMKDRRGTRQVPLMMTGACPRNL
jgi:hypothetical protein